MQRTFKDEFYRRTAVPDELEAAQALLDGYLHRYNYHRPHAGLQYRSPMAYLDARNTLHSFHKT